MIGHTRPNPLPAGRGSSSSRWTTVQRVIVDASDSPILHVVTASAILAHPQTPALTLTPAPKLALDNSPARGSGRVRFPDLARSNGFSRPQASAGLAHTRSSPSSGPSRKPSCVMSSEARHLVYVLLGSIRRSLNQGSAKVVAKARSLARDRQMSSIGRRRAIGDCAQSAASKRGHTATLTGPYPSLSALLRRDTLGTAPGKWRLCSGRKGERGST